MKIAITATGPTLEAKVDPRFGRCPCFLFVETGDLSFDAVENPSVALGGGAGIQSAQLMAEHGVKHVLTGNCGPNAYQTLSAAGIGVIIGCSGPVRQVIEQYKSGQLKAASDPNVASHFGMGASSPEAQTAAVADADPTGGGGMGQGRGMGMGHGQGGGRGMGRGMGRCRKAGLGNGAAGNQPSAVQSGEDELLVLKQQADALGVQMRQIQQRIRELEQEKAHG